MVSPTLLSAFLLVLAAAAMVWRQDRRAAIHHLPRYGVVLIACLSLTLVLQHVLHRSLEGSVVAGFVLTGLLLANRLPAVKRVIVYGLGAVLLVAVPASPIMLAVAGAGLLVAAPLKLIAPAAGIRPGLSRNLKGGGRAVHSSVD